MADGTSIEWTDATWNPVTGCSVVSPGCTNCYAMKLAGTRLRNTASRRGLTRDSKAGPVWTGEVRLNEEWLDQPLRWRRPRKIFVCAHGDLFAENVPDEWIDRVFAVMALAPQHTFQVLTKRAKRMREYLTRPYRAGQFTSILEDGRAIDTPAAHVRTHAAMCDLLPKAPAAALNRASAWQARHNPGDDGFIRFWPLPNVWLGVSAEDHARAAERVPELLATPAAVHFVSAEPLLGQINFHWMYMAGTNGLDALSGETEERETGRLLPGPKLDWIIVGGESGQDARPMHPAWARSIRDQCAAHSVPFFFKQWGAWAWSPDTMNFAEGEAWARSVGANFFEQHSSGHTAALIGKHRAGRLLDGVEHNALPEGRSTELRFESGKRL